MAESGRRGSRSSGAATAAATARPRERQPAGAQPRPVMLLVLLLLVAAAVTLPRRAAAECILSDASPAEAQAMQETVSALTGIFTKLNGPAWTFRDLSEVIGAADMYGSLRWGSCAACRVPLREGPGSGSGGSGSAPPPLLSASHGPFDDLQQQQQHDSSSSSSNSVSTLNNTLQLPSYCCWRGVSCCHETMLRGSGGGGGGGGGGAASAYGGGAAGLLLGAAPDGSSCVANGSSAGGSEGASPRAGKLCRRYAVTSLQLWGLNLSGPFQAILPELMLLHDNGLTHLDLSKNGLTGSLPDAIGELSSLTGLLLGSNNITGSVPPSLGRLVQLQQLDLEVNKLGGSLSAGQLCPPGNRLRLLLIRGNNFGGTLNLRDCSALQLADIQGNRFVGPLPVGGSNRGLSVLRAEHNWFNGSIPLGLWDLPALMTLDLTNNSLTGTLPKAVASANFLTQLRLGSNRLRGTLPLALTTLSHLAELDVSDNPELGGTLPRMNWMLGLQSLSVRHTSVRGTIPPELAALPYLASVDLRDTHMTCCGSRREAEARRSNGTLLPPYLTLNELQPDSSGSSGGGSDSGSSGRGWGSGGSGSSAAFEEEFITANGNIKCGMVKRSPAAAMVAQGWVSTPMNLSKQSWLIDPEYTWFMRCACLKGYEPAGLVSTGFPIACARGLPAGGGSSSGGGGGLVLGGQGSADTPEWCEDVMSVMTCRPVAAPQAHPSLIAGIVVGGSLLLLLALLAHVSLGRVSKVRRQLDWWRKHLAGLPRAGGDMSLVVTDIEGYSGMFKRAPEAMYRALTLHNNVIRRAKYAHCGSIVQQEGDSFTLAFHSAVDAVAFSLQVQLGLMEVAWPEGLADAEGNDDGSSASGCGGPAGETDSEADGGASGDASGTSPTRRKLSHRLGEGVSSMLLLSSGGHGGGSGSHGSITGRGGRRSRLAGGSPVPAHQQQEAAAAGHSAAHALSLVVDCRRGRSTSCEAAAAAAGGGASTPPGSAGSSPLSSAQSTPTKAAGAARAKPPPLEAPPAGALIGAGLHRAPGGCARAALCPAASAHHSSPQQQSVASSSSPSRAGLSAGSRLLASLGVGHAAAASSASMGSSASKPFWASTRGGADGGTAAGTAPSASRGAVSKARSGGSGSSAGSGSDGSVSDGLFNGLRVRMGVVTGVVPLLGHSSSSSSMGPGGAADAAGGSSASGGGGGSDNAAAAQLAAITNSSLYKLALDVSDAGNGGQVLLCDATCARIREELAPLGLVDAHGINYASLADARPQLRGLWRWCGGRQQRSHKGRLQPDEAVLLDMGLWEHQGPPPTTPASPHNGYARQCAPAQHSQALPGAMPLWQPGRPSQPGGAEGSAGAAAGCADSKGAPPPPRSPTTPAGEAAAGGGGWGLWHAAGSSAGGACDSSACQHNSNAGGVQRLRLYQILHPSLADRALVWGNTLSLRGAWVCKDGPYFDAPAALFFSLCAGGGSSGSGSGSSAPASLCPPASSSITSSKGPVDMVGMWQLKSHLHHPHQQQARGSTSTAYTIPTAHSHAVRASSAAGGLLRTGSAAAPAAALPGLRLKCSSATAACTCGPEAPAGAPAPQQVSGLRTPSAADVEVRLQDQRGQQAQHVPCVLALQLPCSVHGSYVVTAGATTCGSSAPSCATAPGAPLGAPRPGVPRSLLPPVTLLFVGVEGAKLLRKQLVRDAHCCLSGLMMEAMRAVPGGYMCRMQAGDLKYMAAFGSPCAALAWALAVQEAAMYLAYTSSAMERCAQLRCEYDGAGRLVFRGPRLKMGLTEGVPRTVMPDHLGRADYYGSSVNMAARFMDAAAHGGQIACELELALAVMQHWGGGRGRSSNGHAALHQQHTHMQLQLQLHHGHCSSSDSPTSASTWGRSSISQPGTPVSLDVQLQAHEQQPAAPALCALQGAPCEPAGVHVSRLGSFRFKGGGALQLVQMANVCLASLAGREAHTPAAPPVGKGDRVAAGGGLAAAGTVPLPLLVGAYRTRVPLHVLVQQQQQQQQQDEGHGGGDGSDGGASAGGSQEGALAVVRQAAGLRTNSAPQHTLGHQREQLLQLVVQVASDGDTDAAGAAVSASRHATAAPEEHEVLLLRKRSHSFTCLHSSSTSASE